ncbi:viperin family antiviral radical SAM protein [Halodesulfovibrio aestuarii]|uniref:viperin family antiviral radical SAM protein n=1 Tax=Halodesulfovibrio aestuarii TaxID=126333 RepID=UPI00040B787F
MQIVLNWHLTEQCNYRCKYCFAQWGRCAEVWRDRDLTSALLAELASWRQQEILSPIILNGGESHCRINFVGGEPLMIGGRLTEIVQEASEQYGFKTSLITNGSLLGRNLKIVSHLDLLGVSVDSFLVDTNRSIGRYSRTSQPLNYYDIKELIQSVRERNPLIKIKFNTVVSQHNWTEVVIPEIAMLHPEKLKIFRQYPYLDQQGITDQMFKSFLKNNSVKQPYVFVEDNAAMQQSYLMIDPSGRFFQNGNGEKYSFSQKIHEVGLPTALEQIKFNSEKYIQRY